MPVTYFFFQNCEHMRNTIMQQQNYDKPYQCKYCDKGFSNNLDLSLHLRTHTGEKPLKYTSCNRSLPNENVFLKHKCSNCNETIS